MDELIAFLDALDRSAPGKATHCSAWTTHDLLAHMVAGTEEMTRLATLAAADGPDPVTRSFVEREAPWRATADDELREAFVPAGARLVCALDALPVGTTVAFTGWAMTADQLRLHARSELALHRRDLVGDDDTGNHLLAQPELIAHGRSVLVHMPTLHEARRTPRPDDDLLTMWGRRR